MSNSELEKTSVLRMAMGAIEERVDYEMSKIIDNIIDPNTKATAKRKVTVTVELVPADDRKTIHVSATAKSTLVATNPIATALYITTDRKSGEMLIAEMVPQIPGQADVYGGEQEDPKILRLAKQA